jgi:xanthine dehydrogenase YagS FAD-binding subunit
MKPFQYARPDSVDDALRILQLYPGARLLGGGTNLVDLMREGIEQPDHLVDI